MINTLIIAASKNNQQLDCGWVAILNDKVISGNLSNATIRRAEMMALKRAVSLLHIGDTIKISIKHPYLATGIASLPKWKQRNWKRANGKIVQNKDLWERLSILLPSLKIEFVAPTENKEPLKKALLIAQACSGKHLNL